ncbi:MAG: hypothetical protein LBV12_01675 [Puniceicoccales bacterium]|jgi:hypothetical protein|nr:hypothetical protein [Puniceicoccales bacterium]
MKKLLLGFLLLFVFYLNTALAQNHVTVATGTADGPNSVYLKNDRVELGFNLNTGLYFVKNAKGQKVIDYAYFQAGGLQSKDACEKITWSSEDISDALGKGKALTIKIAFENYADTLWQARMYEEAPFLIFNMGINNDTSTPYQLMSFPAGQRVSSVHIQRDKIS